MSPRPSTWCDLHRGLEVSKAGKPFCRLLSTVTWKENPTESVYRTQQNNRLDIDYGKAHSEGFIFPWISYMSHPNNKEILILICTGMQFNRLSIFYFLRFERVREICLVTSVATRQCASSLLLQPQSVLDIPRYIWTTCVNPKMNIFRFLGIFVFSFL